MPELGNRARHGGPRLGHGLLGQHAHLLLDRGEPVGELGDDVGAGPAGRVAGRGQLLPHRNAGRTLGEDDLTPLLAGCAGLSAAATAAAVRRAVVDYAPRPPLDDMAVLVLRAIAAGPG